MNSNILIILIIIFVITVAIGIAKKFVSENIRNLLNDLFVIGIGICWIVGLSYLYFSKGDVSFWEN